MESSSFIHTNILSLYKAKGQVIDSSYRWFAASDSVILRETEITLDL